MGRFILIFFIAACAVFVYLHEQLTATRLSYKVAALKTEYGIVDTENKLLLLKINSMLGIEKLDKAAKEKGLIKPDESQIVYLD
jgi:hypothetical protein